MTLIKQLTKQNSSLEQLLFLTKHVKRSDLQQTVQSMLDSQQINGTYNTDLFMNMLLLISKLMINTDGVDATLNTLLTLYRTKK